MIGKPAVRNWAAQIYSHYPSFPVCITANIFAKRKSDNKSLYRIHSKWNQSDSLRNDSIVSHQEYIISLGTGNEAPKLEFSSSPNVASFGSCFPYAKDTGVKVMWDIVQDNTRAIFTEYSLPTQALGDTGAMKASAALPGTYVHVLCTKSGRRLKTIKLPTEDTKSSSAKHGKVFGCSGSPTPFSSCRFNPTNPNSLIYLAEASEGNTASVIPEKSPFLLKQNWGEGLSDVVHPVICLLDLETEEVTCLQSKLEEIAPSSRTWAISEAQYTPDGKGIVFVAYDTEPYRLGLIYCYQRASHLMYWDLEKSELTRLSRESQGASWPRFSPNGSKLIWFEMPAGGPHNQCFAMLCQDWPPQKTEPRVVVPLVASVSKATDFPGLYLCVGVPERCWTSDSSGVILSTVWGASRALIHVGLDGSVSRFASPLANVKSGSGGYGSVALLEVNDDVIAAKASSPIVPDFLAVACFSKENVLNTAWLNLTLMADDEPHIPLLEGVSWKILEHSATEKDPRFGVASFESILIRPNGGAASVQFSSGPTFKDKEMSWQEPRGLMVIPHGGPHSAFEAQWLPSLAAYLASGFACLLINYRGSVGYGNCSVYCLPGKCGTIDVADCVQATEEALSELGNPCLPCLLHGGSHGGFLVLHLAGRYASRYRAVVARNPVTNLVSMLSTTDIPDWVWTEAGLGLDDSAAAADAEHPERLCREWSFTSSFCPTDPKDLARLAACSPIVHVTAKWSVPLLMCLGAKDLRVPNEQGLAFVRAVRSHLGEGATETMCQTLRFPTEAHPIQNPAAAEDNFVRAVEWYYQALGLLKP